MDRFAQCTGFWSFVLFLNLHIQLTGLLLPFARLGQASGVVSTTMENCGQGQFGVVLWSNVEKADVSDSILVKDQVQNCIFF